MMKKIVALALFSGVSLSAFAQVPPSANPPVAPQAAPVVQQPVAPQLQQYQPNANQSMLDEEDKRTLREISKMQVDLKLKSMVKESKKLDYEIDEIERRNVQPGSTQQVRPEDPQFMLTGVYGDENELKAEIRLPSGGRFTVAEKSTLPDGFFVKKVTPNSVVVTKGPKAKKEYVVWMVGASKGTSLSTERSSGFGATPIPAASISFPGVRQ